MSPTEVMQEGVLSPSINTVQARHWPSPQPNFVPVNCKSSRNTSSKDRSGSVVTVCGLPFRVKLILVSINSALNFGVFINYNEPQSARVNAKLWTSKNVTASRAAVSYRFWCRKKWLWPSPR